MLPNFLCIGAQKAGTTSVCRLLEMHPEVFMSRPRETRFFVDDALHAAGAAGYEISFFGGWAGEAAVGEKTPEYLLFDDTPMRVRALLGEAVRIIVCLRSPAARAVSHYRHNLKMLVETLPFPAAIAREPERTRSGRAQTAYYGYHYRGCYAERLEPWLRCFDRSRFLFLDFDELSDPLRSDTVRRRLFGFLGVADLPGTGFPHEGTALPPAWEIAGDAVHIRAGGVTRTVRGASGQLVAHARTAAALAETVLGLPGPAEMNRLWWRYDIERLGALTGSDHGHWLA